MKTMFFLISCAIFILFTGCQGNQNEKDISSAASDTISATGLTADSVKLVKSASILFKVKNVHQTVRTVSQLSKRFGGMIRHQSIDAIEDQTTKLKISSDSLTIISSYIIQGEIIVLVPSKNLEEFIYNVEDLGYFISSSTLDIDDKSFYYLGTQLKTQNRKDILNASVNSTLKYSNNRQLINTRDEVTDQEIAKRQIDTDVKYSTVKLSLFQNPLITKETIVSNSVAHYHLPFGKSMCDALSSGWEYFLNFIIALAHLWMFILLAVAGWLSFRYYKHKRSRLVFGSK